VSETFKAIIALTIISLGGGGVVAFFHSFLSPSIETRETSERQIAAQGMFASGVSVRGAIGKKTLPAIYWIGKKDGVTIEYVFPVEARSFSSVINSLVAIDTAGTIFWIKILAERRIPGQGTALKDRFPGKSIWGRLFGKKETIRPWFIEQFEGMSATSPFIVDTVTHGAALSDTEKKERRAGNVISAVTGATMSTRAIVKAIEKNSALFLSAIKRQEQ
jgi:Na+-translocating ferredoxin:NAD+ oxidoreductase RnfG subunit